jgi:hypothetical protein
MICAVLDTNVWVYQSRMLRTPLGAAFLFAVHRLPAKIGLPEVVEREVAKRVELLAGELIERAVDAHRQALQLVGRLPEFASPSEPLNAAARERLAELDGVIHRVPFSFDQASRALDKVIAETPPNGPKDQQFKDSVLWEAVVDLSREFEVHFVTQDKGFFEGRDPRQGLAAVLAAEVADLGVAIRIHHGLEAFATSVAGSVPPIDLDRVARDLEVLLAKTLDGLRERQGVEVVGLERHDIGSYLTEDVATLALAFTLEFGGVMRSSETEYEQTIRIAVKGEARLLLPKEEVAGLELDRIDLYSPTGDRMPGGGIWVRAGFGGSGPRSVKHVLRAPLERPSS